ncbi:MAG TPA: glycosyltransferase family 1 protein [Ruminococcus sp.]|nr:glycosyltransferase family 1 protein [Ruminococcus sp.]
MGKRILVTSTDLMMIQFLVPHVINLSENGFEVEIACSVVGNRIEEVRQKLNGYVNAIHLVRLVRSPVSPTNFKGYKDMKKVINSGNYDIIWTNEPVMGLTTRLAARKARKNGTKVFYMVHGFHFYKGAPKLNWLVFYPIEKFMAGFCDKLITINNEDYELASKKFHCDVARIHGIGVSAECYHTISRDEKIQRLSAEGMSGDEFIVLCTGELNENKDQKTLIAAAAKLKNKIPNLIVFLAGKGVLEEQLKAQVLELDLNGVVKFLGYRKDLFLLTPAVNMVVSCSHREEMPRNILEAMLCKKPVVATKNRGHNELVDNDITGYLIKPGDSDTLAQKIYKIYSSEDDAVTMGNMGFKKVQSYTTSSVQNEFKNIFNF